MSKADTKKHSWRSFRIVCNLYIQRGKSKATQRFQCQLKDSYLCTQWIKQRAADKVFSFPRKLNYCSVLLPSITLLVCSCARRSQQTRDRKPKSVVLPEKQSQLGSILQSQSDGVPAIMEISPLVVTCCIRLIFLSSVSAM